MGYVFHEVFDFLVLLSQSALKTMTNGNAEFSNTREFQMDLCSDPFLLDGFVLHSAFYYFQ